MRLAVMALLLAGGSAAADTEIHRCPQEDGTFAFQEMPCPEPAVSDDGGAETGDSGDAEPVAEDDAFDFVNPFDEPVNPPEPAEPALPESVSGDRAECEQSTREAIDAIDRELASTEEQAQERLPELLALTRQLRACKQL